MKTTTQIIQWKNWKATKALLMLGLALTTLTSVVEIAQAAKPPVWVPSQAVSVYPAEVYPVGPPLNALISYVPGTVGGGGSVIFWNWYFEAKIQLDTYAIEVGGVSISLIRNNAGQVGSVRVGGQGGPPGGPWPYHDTDLIPVANKPVFNLVTGFTLQIRLDNIPVYRHATDKTKSPRVGVAGSVSLGDLVISPKP